MAKVFISYSRKDIEFAKRLTGELQKSELDFWIDWEGIPPTVDWWKEIEKGIEEADNFLFLISPDSVKSKICKDEINTAVKNGKRIIPIVVREIESQAAPPQLKHLNYIFFSRNDDFDTATAKLLTAIQTDYQWVATHRRLQVRALEWERNNKENSLLLRGKDLQEAEFQLATNSSKEPYPTDLQFEYASASRRAEDRQHRLSRRSRVIVSIIGVVLLTTIGLAMNGKFNRFIYPPVDMEGYWVTVPQGDFPMGSNNSDNPDEALMHTVYLDEFQIGKYEVTNLQYKQCVRAGSCGGVPDVGTEKELHPVSNITWQDAVAYCEWVGGRLPTEAEWEKAARDTDGRTYPWGEEIDCNKANYQPSCFEGTHAVGGYEAGKSPYGLYDMAGNVWEWTSDWYAETYYQTSPSSNPPGPDNTGYKVLRGGSLYDDDRMTRSTARAWDDPANPDPFYLVGIRCARNVP